MTSPFFFGGPIPTAQAPKFLHGYEEERRILVQVLNRRSSQQVAILGGPGSGKTSVLLAIAPQVPSRAHLNCARISPATTQQYFRLLQQGLDIAGPIPSGATTADAYHQLAAARKAGRMVLVLENAHELASIHEDLVGELPVLTARLGHHVVLTGPKQELEGTAAETIELQPFSEATSADFLRARFAQARIQLEDGAEKAFYEFTRGQPERLQRLGHAAWDLAMREHGTRIGQADVDAAMLDVVDRLPSSALEPWAGIRGLMRDIFIAMCLYDLESPTAIAQRLGLEAKNVIVLLTRLQQAHGLVERPGRGLYRVHDPFLKTYIRKEWGSPILR